MSFEGNTTFTYVIFALISVISFTGNSLVLYVFFRKPSFLRHPYNIFIFSLAVTDVLTSIFLIFSRFLFLPPMPENATGREFYCRAIWGALVVFDLNYISVYNALALTVERWLAIVKPLVYRSIKQHHAVAAVIFVWIWGILVNATSIFRAKFDNLTRKCTWTALPVANEDLPWLDFMLQTVIPYLAVFALYIHILIVMKKLEKGNSARYLSLQKVTVVAFVTTTGIAVAGIPSRITFMLSKFGLVDADSLLHFSLVTLTFSNACFNPIIYGICNPQYRKEYKEILQPLFRKQPQRVEGLAQS